MSRILKSIFRNEEIVNCPYCQERIAYTNDDIQTEKIVEGYDWGYEHWQRDYIICPNCRKKITWNWK